MACVYVIPTVCAIPCARRCSVTSMFQYYQDIRYEANIDVSSCEVSDYERVHRYFCAPTYICVVALTTPARGRRVEVIVLVTNPVYQTVVIENFTSSRVSAVLACAVCAVIVA